MLASNNWVGVLLLEEVLELLVFNLTIARIIDLFDQFLDVYRQLELLLDDAHQNLRVDMTTLILGSSDRYVGVQGVLVVLAKHLY